jgi:hypothetical protein
MITRNCFGSQEVSSVPRSWKRDYRKAGLSATALMARDQAQREIYPETPCSRCKLGVAEHAKGLCDECFLKLEWSDHA